MKKLLFLVLVFGLVVGMMPPQAQAFEVGNIFSSIGSSFKQRIQRVYLALPGNKSGEAVVEQSFAAMEQVETLHSDTDVKAVMEKDNQELLNFALSMSGPVKVMDVYDPTTYQQEMKVVGTLAVEGTTMTADADVKMDGQTLYVKFNQIPAMPFLPVSSLKDQWLKMESTAASMTEADTTTENSLTDDQRRELQELYTDFLKEIELSEARREEVDGVKAFVVDATVTPDQLKTYLRRAAEIEGRSAEEIDEMMASVDKALALMSEIKATLAIDRSSFYLTKVEVPLTFDLSKVDQSTASQLDAQVMPLGEAAEADTLELTTTVRMSQFNKPVEFTVPTDARDAAEVFAEVMGSAMGGVMPASLDAGKGVGAGAVMVPPAALQNSRRPVELPSLSAEEEAMLKQYGIDPATLR